MCSEEGEDRLLLDVWPTCDVDNQIAKLLPVTERKKKREYPFIIVCNACPLNNLQYPSNMMQRSIILTSVKYSNHSLNKC